MNADARPIPGTEPPDDGPDLVTLAGYPHADHPHHVRGPYVERFWLPILGPSAVMLARRVGLDYATSPTPRTVSLAGLAYDLGLGRRAGLARRVLDRLAAFGLADASPDRLVYEVAVTWPRISAKQAHRLGEQLAADEPAAHAAEATR